LKDFLNRHSFEMTLLIIALCVLVALDEIIHLLRKGRFVVVAMPIENDPNPHGNKSPIIEGEIIEKDDN